MSYDIQVAAVAISIASIIIAILSVGVTLVLRGFAGVTSAHDALEKMVRENRQEYVRDVGEIRVSLAEIGSDIQNINEKLSPETLELQRRARQ